MTKLSTHNISASVTASLVKNSFTDELKDFSPLLVALVVDGAVDDTKN